MKKAKIILTCVAILAIAGGALAFKAKIGTSPKAYTFTTITSSTVDGIVYTATGTFCVPLNNLWINTVNDLGSPSIVYSTSTVATSATFSSAGHPTFTRTFPSCPLTTTLVTAIQ